MGLSKRNVAIDYLKAVSIISIVLYHLGLFRFGFLGVDIFFVIAGFLSMRSVAAHISTGFNFARFVKSKLTRFYPLMLICSVLLIVVGYVCYAPCMYRQVSGEIVATCSFMENVQLWRSAGDYWASSNETNPLMHFWYISALMQILIAFALCMCGATVKTLNKRIYCVYVLGIASLMSFIIGIPNRSAAYFFPSARFAEFAFGALLSRLHFSNRRFAWTMPNLLRPLSAIGIASFSIYVWHQPVIALFRYASIIESPWLMRIVALSLIALISFLSYLYVEKRMKPQISVLLLSLLIVMGLAFYVHSQKGLIRDIPELGIYVQCQNADADMQYNDSPRQWATKPFKNDGRLKMLFVGDSFARDCINALHESVCSNHVNLSYCETSAMPSDFKARYVDADLVYYAKGSEEFDLPDSLKNVANECGKSKLFVVGYKYLGNSIGKALLRLRLFDCASIVCEIPEEVAEANQRMRSKFGAHYIDLQDAMADSASRINILQNCSGKKRLTTFDCYHFSRFGAIFYGDLLCRILVDKK